MQSTKYGWMVLWSLIGIMMFLTGLLLFEWFELQHQVLRLKKIKQEYKQYLICDQEEEAYEHGDAKFDPNVFMIVNREPEYLRDSALLFARTYQLEDAIQMLYQEEELPGFSPTRTTKKTRPSPATRSVAPKIIKSQPRRFKKLDFSGQWPLDRAQFWISSKFGPRRKRNGSWGFHYGIDMAALKGTPVYAVAPGKVVEATYSPSGYGNCIVIEHNKKYKTRYAHLDTMYVKQGQNVVAGSLIGKVGATGAVRGKNASHLHFEVQVFGKRINPLYILT
jgi:murein DD-endopeptidase MepM/ murein hydrolase activator NlpD